MSKPLLALQTTQLRDFVANDPGGFLRRAAGKARNVKAELTESDGPSQERALAFKAKRLEASARTKES